MNLYYFGKLVCVVEKSLNFFWFKFGSYKKSFSLLHPTSEQRVTEERKDVEMMV